MTVFQILKEINENNSTNYKLGLLKKYENHDLLKRVLKMTYDKVTFTYGMSLKSLMNTNHLIFKNTSSLKTVLDFLENSICTRNITGNAALSAVRNNINCLSPQNAEIVQNIINRDIKCNLGRTQLNKIWPGLITKPAYMRCSVYGEKTAKKIKFPAILQLKADGTYREFTVNDEVTCVSRTGESYNYSKIFENMKTLPSGIYTGELTVVQNGETLPRSQGNGMINSHDVPYDNIVFDVWDFITLQEYASASKKEKLKDFVQKGLTKKDYDMSRNKTNYKMRFETLQTNIKNLNCSNIRVIETIVVKNITEALEQTSVWMNAGLEGSVLKNMSGLFKDGTSTDQLKLKICIDTEMRVTGFKPGKLGTKRAGKVGSVEFANDECTIKGYCSGFSDAVLDNMTNFPEQYLNKIMTVQFNDLTKSITNDFYALCHPRFIEMRPDKNITDTLNVVRELREMSMKLKPND